MSMAGDSGTHMLYDYLPGLIVRPLDLRFEDLNLNLDSTIYQL